MGSARDLPTNMDHEGEAEPFVLYDPDEHAAQIQAFLFMDEARAASSAARGAGVPAAVTAGAQASAARAFGG